MLTRCPTQNRERIALWALTLALTSILALHASAEFLFALPVNPLGELLRPVVLGYMHPYFEQYWNMFAPTPIESDLVVVARTRPEFGQSTPWVNLTDPLLSELRAHPLSLYSTLKVGAMNLSVAALDDRLLGKGTFTRAQIATLTNPRTRPMILAGLVRLALFLGVGRNTHAQNIQLAILEHRFPRFTHRFERDDPTQHNQTLLFPWLPIDAASAQVAQ